MGDAITVEWSEDALADLDRFAQFLQADHPDLASIIAGEILSRIQLLADFPKLGRPIATRRSTASSSCAYSASYVFQYRYDGTRLVMLRVFYGREQRPWDAECPL